ncbi:EutN/CcmL family microcompartment protein [Companilactobacillus sp. HBUAS56257]|uniref:EutN/CcmL family microcompartment protein n=1 Tax=Companilactobacillus sp. HBUAS56257 TaxID=3109360 RepID=UPI002FF14BDD
MVTAKLIDNVWATRKADNLNGLKLMLAKVIGGTRAGEQIVVCDVIGAGIGDRVIVASGSAARRMLGDNDIPIDAAVIGIIDENCTTV